MNKLYNVIAIFFLSILSFSVFAEPILLMPAFPSTLTLAGIEWRSAFQREDKNVKIQKYITNNQTLDHWTQMVTLEQFKHPLPNDVAPIDFMNREMTQLSSQQFNVDYKIITASPKEAMIEFKVKEPLTQQQDELQRLVVVNGNFYVFHYVSKQYDMGKTARDAWIDILKNMSIN